MGALAGDGREGLLAETRLLGAKLGDPLANLVLVPLLTRRRLLVEPAPEGRHRDAVAEVRLEHPRELSLVLHGLGQRDRGDALLDGLFIFARVRLRAFVSRAGGRGGFLRSLRERHAHLIRVDPERLARGGRGAHVFGAGIVRLDRHARLGEVRPHFVRRLALVHVEARVVFADEAVPERDRVVVEVTAADVEQPGDFVQRGDHQDVALVLAELASDEFDLVGDGLTAELSLVHPERRGGKRRSFGAPHRVHRVNSEGHHGASHGFEGGAEGASFGEGVHVRVDADSGSLGHLICEPLGWFGDAGLAAAHEGPLRAELLLSLEEVTAVGP